MDLTAALTRLAANQPHVLLVPAPGGRAVRWAVQAQLHTAGWPLATSPADADLLVVCGQAGPELAPAIEVAWDSMPGPRARATVVQPGDARQALADVRAQLADRPGQQRDARQRPAPALGAPPAQQHDEHDEHDRYDSGTAGGHEVASDHDMDHMDHMDHMDMDMELPGGLVMADRDDDRDGLRLDVLHLSWGPVLPHWPAGLVLETVLAGDVLRQVRVRLLDPRPEPAADGRTEALDDLAHLLAAAGWDSMAVRLSRCQDHPVPAELTALTRRIERSRLLRWSLRLLPGPGGSDLPGHLGELLERARHGGPRPQANTVQLEQALVGLELGAARPVIAAFAPCLSVPQASHA